MKIRQNIHDKNKIRDKIGENVDSLMNEKKQNVTYQSTLWFDKRPILTIHFVI